MRSNDNANIVRRLFYNLQYEWVRERPFNLKGEGGGYGGFFIRPEKKIRTTQELEYFIFFVAQSANFFSRI
jgi:hypothetical protein